MYNHLRTLLLNQDGNAVLPDYTIGEAAVPADFRAVNLPAYLDEIRSRLFGSNPDRSMLNYRLAQYTKLLHATELASYVDALDPRVTYSESILDLFGASAFTPMVSENGYPLVVQGNPAMPDATGRMYHYYIAERADEDTLYVQQVLPTSKNRILELTFTDGLSAAVPLGESGYRLLVPSSPVATTWRIAFHNRPQWDLGQILAALRVAGEPTLLQLFGASPVEPYLTFRNLFQEHKELAYRLGGLLLAVAYRTDEVWRATSG